MKKGRGGSLMKKIFLYSTMVLTCIIVSGCQGNNNVKKEPEISEINVSENVGAYSKEYKKQSTDNGNVKSEDVSISDPKRKEAYDNLQKYKATVKEQAILNALSIIDEIYISNNTLQATRKAYGVKTEEEVYKKVFSYYQGDYINGDKDYIFEFQNKTYPVSDIGPKALKIHVNSLQESAAYEVAFSKLEDKKVYLHLRVPSVDAYQYVVKSTYRDDYDTFFVPLAKMADKAKQEKDVNKVVSATFLYYLESVGSEDGRVDLVGMSWGQLRDIYLAFDVKDDQSISLTDEMVSGMMQMSSAETNGKLKSKFEQLEAQN